MKDFNTEPYFNDFDENNKFYSILFRPSVAVQARELNQLQTILQNQIKSQGDHIFKNGTVVIPGEFSINTSIDYVTLSNIGNTSDVANLIGNKIKNTTGLEALVVHAVSANTTDLTTLFVSYTKSATNKIDKVFSNNDTLSTIDGTYNSIAVSNAASTGLGSIATIQRGVYYINGYFVLCDTQTIILEKYNTLPSYRIGFNVIESAITSDDIGYDSLFDNAQGSYNYAAPGAHRYFIDLVLDKLTIDSSSEIFTELGRVVNGNIITAITTTGYSQLARTLARRTYDESGDYTVKPFQIDVREHRNNNRGVWNSGKSYKAGDIVSNVVSTITYYYQAIADMNAALAAPVHTSNIVNSWEQKTNPDYNRGIYSADAIGSIVGDIDKLAVGFEPGKAYVQGYEIEKLATTYVEVAKPRDPILDVATDPQSSVPTSVGSFVQVIEVHKLPDFTNGAIVTIYDSIVTSAGTPAGSSIGTCRISGIETEVSNICKMFIYDVKLISGKSFSRDAKSFGYATNNFTANVLFDTTSSYLVPIGTVTVTTAGIVTGQGTTFLKTLKTGDWVYYNGARGVVPASFNDLGFTFDSGVGVISTSVQMYRIETYLSEPDNTSLVFPLPHYATNTISDHIYYVMKAASIDSVVGTGVGSSLHISIGAGNFLPDLSNYYVQDTNGATVIPSSVSSTSGTAILTFGATPALTYTVFATIEKHGITSRITKTLTPATTTFVYPTATNSSILTLEKADCYKIVSIKMGIVDITDWYLFNDGQKDYYYDQGTLTLQPSYPTPTHSVVVNYQYFEHSSGDFCDKNSYINIDNTLIPNYSNINLRDAIDFRPVLDSSSLLSTSKFKSINPLCMPKRGYNMNVNLSYYLARQDKLSLDINGNFFLIKGSSSLTPGIPTDSSNGMTLCTIALAPYTFDIINDVIVTKVENKRYTMRDIGKLESRINNIEYYTSLSLLEQETSSLNITDASGLDRFKNGFIVDNFSGHNIGDITSPDYMCAIDMENNELRPFSSIDNINLVVNTNLSTNYKLYGDVITLPLNSTEPHVELAKNPFASRTEFVNPFAVFTFLGNVKMNPSSDDWFEIKRLPDIITNKEGNFSIMTALAERTGVLGTVWNSWQTQWTGSPVETSSTFKKITDKTRPHFVKGDPKTGWLKKITTKTFATEIGQSRTGINTTAVAKIDTQVVDDKILSIAVIPYIRSRNILIQVQGLKPDTTFYPFFDNISVSSSCIAATKFSYTPISGSFDTSTNSGIDSTINIARKINGDSEICLNIGDVVYGATATAVVVGKDKIISNTGIISYHLFVLNVIGTFVTNETIIGSISGALGTFLSPTIPAADTFVSNSCGDLNLQFLIPDNDVVRFRTGKREFKLQDNNNVKGQYTSQGISNYVASGTLQTKQSNVVATRNVEFVQTQVSEDRTIIHSSSRTSESGWYDPLAQTFRVESKGGAFISKVDLFFASKDGNIPVSIEIRETDNGYPGATVLPFSRVTIRSEDVQLSSNSVLVDGVSYPKFDTPTTITFPSPIYVNDKTDYALVILSDSNQYKVWISQMGDVIPDTLEPISKQPYLGVLYKSQNAASWTPSDNQDLKFTIWRANFDTEVTGNVILTNDLVPKFTLMTNPIQTLAGSSTVRVWHENHGFKTGDLVSLSRVFSTDSAITALILNNTFSISNPQLDSYTIVVSANATSTGYIGGTEMLATKSILYETIHPNIKSLGFSDTSLDYNILTTKASDNLTISESCIVNDNNYFNTPRKIANGDTGKLNVTAIMDSNNSALSPMIDTHGSSAIVISNKINSPIESSFNIATVDRVAILSGAVFILTANTITAPLAVNQEKLKRIIPGSYIQVSDSAGTGTNSANVLVTAVNSLTGVVTVLGTPFTAGTAGAGANLYYFNSFFNEITPVGSSSHSKYVSKVITLAIQANLLRIKYAVCAPTESDVLVYYKVGTNGTDLSTVNWTLLPPDSTMPKTAIGSDTFYDVDYTKEGLTSFDVLTVKLVMKSTNTAAIPRVKDLRIIACA